MTTDKDNVKKYYWIVGSNLQTKEQAIKNAKNYQLSYPNSDMVLVEAIGVIKTAKAAIADLPTIEV